jgi:hypothetical protein
MRAEHELLRAFLLILLEYQLNAPYPMGLFKKKPDRLLPCLRSPPARARTGGPALRQWGMNVPRT